MKKRGVISVFLVLIFTCMTSFFAVLFSSAKRFGVRAEAVLATDAAVRSCFAEYNRKLFDRFGILLIDSSYKTEDADMEKIGDHFRMYLENSLTKSEVVEAYICDGKTAAGNDNAYLFDSAVTYIEENGGVDQRVREAGDKALFISYLADKLGNGEAPVEGSFRRGEVEFILYGMEEDVENIKLARQDMPDDEEVDYEEYLIGKLEEEDIENMKDRFARLITEYMKSNDSPGFDPDKCYHSLTFAAVVRGAGTDEYCVTRKYSY